ncbi:MAG: hypothetical protein AAB338_01990 [Patescibacteria group bacterium]
MKKNILSSTIFATAIFYILLSFGHDAQAVTLEIRGNKFTVDGQNKFLVLAGYFDGMDAPNPAADLNYLKSKGFDGIRIFPNWWNELNPLIPDSDPLINSDGTLNQGKLSQLISIVGTADSKSMIIDVSFAREVVDGGCNNANLNPGVLCKEEFKKGVVATAQALSNYTNVFYDLSNEHDYPGINFPRTDILDLKRRIENAIGTRSILSVSSADPSGPTAVGIANGYPMDIVHVHFAGGQELGSDLSSALTPEKPTYIGEPNNTRSVPNYSAQDLISAVVKAKRIGIAAWVFHTDAGFKLNGVSLRSKFEANENEMGFINSFKSAVDATPWGGTGQLPPNPGNCVPRPTTQNLPNMESLVRQVASEYPDWLTNSCQNQGGTWQFMDEVVGRLNTRDPRFGFNCKRGNCNDPSNDAISYYYGSAPVPPSGIKAYEVFVIDIIGGHCGPNPSPAWQNVTQPGGALGGYLYPRTAGYSLPSANWCSGGGEPNPQPPRPQPPGPAPVPGLNPPLIIGADPNTVRAGQKLSIIGTDLTSNIKIELANGQFNYEFNASLNSQKTNAEITLPAQIPAGSYFVTVSGPVGSDTKANLFTVQGEPVPAQPPAEPRDFGELIQSIFSWALALVGAAVFINFFWAGFLWFTAAGRPGPINQAKEKMTNALIGATILLASFLILKTINPDLVQQIFTLPGL